MKGSATIDLSGLREKRPVSGFAYDPQWIRGNDEWMFDAMKRCAGCDGTLEEHSDNNLRRYNASRRFPHPAISKSSGILNYGIFHSAGKDPKPYFAFDFEEGGFWFASVTFIYKKIIRQHGCVKHASRNKNPSLKTLPANGLLFVRLLDVKATPKIESWIAAQHDEMLRCFFPAPVEIAEQHMVSGLEE